FTYNRLRDNSTLRAKFYIINFDEPERSHRCNPLLASSLNDITDAYESAYSMMLNLNRSWIKKQGDFFVESPINIVTACIWFLKRYDQGQYCTLPHVIELLTSPYEEMFPVLLDHPELEVYMQPFVSAYKRGTFDQLEGQIASARIGMARLVSPPLYWVMSGNDFTLDINNPNDPKILCLANNEERRAVYGAALGLYNSRLIRMINKPGKIPCGVIIDELPTIFFRGLDHLINTARSNLVAVLLGFQDFSQLVRDYGREEATVIKNTIGNVFVGNVVGETAKELSQRFGKIKQKQHSHSITTTGTTENLSSRMDTRIPDSVMSELSQGTFVGTVADSKEIKIKLKVFHADVKVDGLLIQRENNSEQPIPAFRQQAFLDAAGRNCKEKVLQENFEKIRQDVKNILQSELKRIQNNDQGEFAA
ncbi:MAG: TraM recognition domain-containing protein, partial [Tunicatimonas sp.]|uniref:TraM recognition domain-containing protein n=1 Tax=Tunicatimonas sp. TaxID=1940096 RepID=UPI003C77A5D3